MIVNLNDNIEATLTEYGKQRIAEDYRKIFAAYAFKEERLQEMIATTVNKTRWQLHDLISHIGQYTSPGHEAMIEGNNITIVEKE